MQLERTLATMQPIEKVFDYMSHFHRVVEWDASVAHAEKLSAGIVTLGTRFAVDVRLMGSTSRFIYTITKIEEPTYIELTGVGEQCTATDRITLAQDPAGVTQMHYSVTLEFSASMQPYTRFMTPFINRNIDAALAGLKRTLNDEPQPLRKFPGWLDKSILPGAVQFTRYGYLWSKKHWKGVASDLSGKTVVVTGASSGLGRAATFELAERGATVIAVVRDETKASELVEAVNKHCANPPRIELCDLSSIRATQLLAQKLLDEGQRIDALINNAGALFNERQVTPENLEKSFALLLLSPFIFTETLLPLLVGTKGRVVNVASGGMYTQAVHLNDLNYENERYDGAKAYARAKRGLVDMTRLWAEKYGDRGVFFHSMHPGWADTIGVVKSLPGFHKLMRPLLRSPEQGADTMVWLAVADEATQCNGEFWLDRRVHTTSVWPGTESSPATREKLYGILLDYLADFSQGNVRVKKRA
jgi:dehydrogenase/reductase SDR family protein 12